MVAQRPVANSLGLILSAGFAFAMGYFILSKRQNEDVSRQQVQLGLPQMSELDWANARWAGVLSVAIGAVLLALGIFGVIRCATGSACPT